ncbi:MAG: Gfo/Idh/MocA family oxidoreductase [Actinomycetota bacterium]|jgi:UDP-N-acetylglucosamine 3-dehydrogenase|nr:Gfo/Idh/MocA family oxidoreductase [Actinomycetota bacterium]
MDTIDIGVIGLGVMGRQHLRVLRGIDDFHVVGVCEPDRGTADQFAGDDPPLAVVPDVAALVDIGITAAVVASPTTAHAEQAGYLVERGIHVLLEKPVAASVAEATRLREVARSHTACLLVGHVERFNPAVRVLKEFLRRGSLGQVVSLSASRVGVGRPAMPSTNVIFDLAIHDVDVVRFLFEEPVRVIGATGGSLPRNVQEDFAHLLLSCGQMTGAVEANWITPRKRRKLFVTGTDGFAELDYIRQEVRAYQGKSELIGDGTDLYHCLLRTADPVSVPVASGEPLQAELRHFAKCIRGEEDPVIVVDEAIDALGCCEQATRMMRQAGSG